MRNLITSLAIAASGFMLSGCASFSSTDGSPNTVVQTTNQWWTKLKMSVAPKELRELFITSVQFKLTMPSAIIMQKQAYDATPIITKSDKRNALLTAKAQMMLLDEGLRTRFTQKASAYGITVSPMAADVIMANVESIYSFCEAGKGCKTRLNISVKVSNLENKVVWSYTGSIEQQTPKQTVNEPMFDQFADTMLQAMQMDGLLKKPE